MIVVEMTPTSVLDFTLDWRPWLKPGRTLVDATASYSAGIAPPPGKTLTHDEFSTTFWVNPSAAIIGDRYEVVVHVEDNEGREDDVSFFIDMVGRV